MATVAAHNVSVGYQKQRILDQLSVDLPEGQISVLVGSNGCGKSTLLKTLARLMSPWSGQVLLDGTAIHELPTQTVARRLALLPQHPVAPEGITVRQLVSLGRHPHQSWFEQWREEDERCVEEALAHTGLSELSERGVDTLSGGQRQRAWIALTVAQNTPLLLLDEPTSFLDLTHQMEVLELLQTLNRDQGKTVVMVLHDLNLAARYADHIVAIKEGRVHAQGTPAEIFTAERIHEVFGLSCRIITDPYFNTPLCIPFGAGFPA
ncbi:ABC transporter ATP-binding protein [Larsenimonas salina]|uniref:ABC transporter ATP-binding protein n=1 Tax=Larsenimonas salina TaxID=1295565 RepID=UPI002074A568|nr:ABC transporter ATP-binding protein [Larsenimonas salina]MCM5704507.1 ABC transporter ATP-binding protein [Larsenimonas salina]